MNEKITIIIYTYNEEKNISACLKSAKLLSDSIIVVDMESADRSKFLAQKAGATIYDFPYTFYVEPARGFGIEKASSDWVFILDADERITSELTNEIKDVIARSETTKQSHFKVPRKNIFGSQWLKHGGWWPDYQIRLINKESFKSWPKEIHSTPKIEGETGFLKQPLIHYFHGDLREMVKKTITFENIESDLLLKADKKVTTLTFFRKFLGEFFRRFLSNLGFLDGNLGIIESIYQAFSKTITYLFLYEKKHVKSRPV